MKVVYIAWKNNPPIYYGHRATTVLPTLRVHYRDPGNSGNIHTNHTYNIARSFEDYILVASAFDGAVILEKTTLCRAEAEKLFDPPGSCTVHAVQGRTVIGKLFIHQARHPYVDVHCLYTVASRANGLSNV